MIADLIVQGIPAFLVGGALPYDLIADYKGQRWRVQVKATAGPKDYRRARGVYRFNLRRARGGVRRLEAGSVDVFAFVVVEHRAVAYFLASELLTADQHIKQCFDLRDGGGYVGRHYPGGKVRSLSWHRMFEGHGQFAALWHEQVAV